MAQARIELEFSKNFHTTTATPPRVKETWDVLCEFHKKMIVLQKHCLILLKTQVNREGLPRLFLSNLISCVKRTESSIKTFGAALKNDVERGGNSQDLAQYKEDIELTLKAAILIYKKRLVELSMLSSNEDLRNLISDTNLQEIYTALDGDLRSPQNPNFSQLKANQRYTDTPTVRNDFIYSGRRIADVGAQVRIQMETPEIPHIYKSTNSIGVFYYKGIPYSANNRGLCLQSIAGVELPVALILSDAEFRGYVDLRTQTIAEQRTTHRLFAPQTQLNTNLIYLEDSNKSVVERPDRLVPMSVLILRVVNAGAAAHEAGSSSEHSLTGG